MNKNKYKDKKKRNNYITVVKAIVQDWRDHPEDINIRLYRTKENGLSSINFSEIKDIVFSLRSDGYIDIRHVPIMSEILPDNTPFEWLSEMNYFLLLPLESFSKLASTYYPSESILTVIPSGEENIKKYKYLSRMLTVLYSKSEVEDYDLALCFNSRLSRSDFDKNKVTHEKYNAFIVNRIKTLKRLLKKQGYGIKRDQNVLKLVKL